MFRGAGLKDFITPASFFMSVQLIDPFRRGGFAGMTEGEITFMLCVFAKQ